MRYVIAKGKQASNVFTLVNVYVLSSSDEVFLRSLFGTIVLENEGTLICAEDFNMILNTKLDTTNNRRNNYPNYSAPC